VVKTAAACAPKAGSTSAAAHNNRMSRPKTGFLPETGSVISQLLLPSWSGVN